MIYTTMNMTEKDIYLWFGVAIVCALFYVISGILMLITKDSKYISRSRSYREPEHFTWLSGIIQVVLAGIILVASIVGMILKTYAFTIFVGVLFVLIALLMAEYIIGKKYEIRKK